jgi:hypothetical protein
VLPLSGATGEGLPAVLDACARVLFAVKPPPARAKRPATKSRVKAAPAAAPRLRTGKTATNRRGTPRRKGPRA